MNADETARPAQSRRRMVLKFIRRRIANAIYYLMEPSSRRIVKHILKDRNLLEQLKSRLESLDLETAVLKGGRRLRSRLDLLTVAMAEARKTPQTGLWLEFGVWKGKSINFIADKAPDTVYGFDSFDGLPETWVKGLYGGAEQGKRKLEELPPVEKNVRLVKGLFQDTLPGFLAGHPDPVSFVHIDSDLYASAKFVLDHLKFQNGSVVVFDDYFNYPSWNEGEHKAFQEFLAKTRASAKCIGYVPHSGQAGFILHFS